MNRQQRLFLFSLGLAVLLHLILPLWLWWWVVEQRPEGPPEAVTMVHLVSLSPQPEPDHPDALAEANHQATKPAPPLSDPPTAAAGEPSTPSEAAPLPEPKAVPKARPVRPKPVVKAVQPQPPVDDPPVADESNTLLPTTEKPAPMPGRTAPRPVSRPTLPMVPETETLSDALNLTPSVERVSRWDRNRQYQAQSIHHGEEVVDLNTRQTRYASYFAMVKQRVEGALVYPTDASRNGLSGRLSLTFTIRWDGTLIQAQVTRPSGLAILDEAALNAIYKAAPFQSFPEEWSLERLTILYTFEFISRRG